MALPVEISTVLMTGTVLDEQGDPFVGAVVLTPSVTTLISASTKRVLRLRQRRLQVSDTGYFEIPLIPSAESDVQPNGVVWTLTLVNDERVEPVSLQFVVPIGITTADIAENVISITTPMEPQYLIGYRGPAGAVGSPGISQAQLTAAIGNGPSTSATASTLVLRDSAGRAKVVAPSASSDIALLQTVTDAVGAEASTRQAADALLIPLTQKDAASGVSSLSSDRSLQLPLQTATPTAAGADTGFFEILGRDDGRLLMRNKGTTPWRRLVAHWGTATSWPTLAQGLQDGDTITRSDVGGGCLFSYNGSLAVWRQEEVPVSANLTAMNAIPSTVRYRGFQTYRSDVGSIFEYQTTTTGWTFPWFDRWGLVSGAVSNGTTVMTSSGQVIYVTAFTMHPTRRYKLSTQYYYAAGSGAAGNTRYALYTYGQITNSAGNVGLATTGSALGHLYGGLADDWVTTTDAWLMNGTAAVSTPTSVLYRIIMYATSNTGAVNSATDVNNGPNVVHTVEDVGPLGAPIP